MLTQPHLDDVPRPAMPDLSHLILERASCQRAGCQRIQLVAPYFELVLATLHSGMWCAAHFPPLRHLRKKALLRSLSVHTPSKSR